MTQQTYSPNFQLFGIGYTNDSHHLALPKETPKEELDYSSITIMCHCLCRVDNYYVGVSTLNHGSF